MVGIFASVNAFAQTEAEPVKPEKTQDELAFEKKAFEKDRGVVLYCSSIVPSRSLTSITESLSKSSDSFAHLLNDRGGELYQIGEGLVGDLYANDFCESLSKALRSHKPELVAKNILQTNEYLGVVYVNHLTKLLDQGRLSDGDYIGKLNEIPLADELTEILVEGRLAYVAKDIELMEESAYELLNYGSPQGFLLMSDAYRLASLKGDAYAAKIAYHKSGHGEAHLRTLLKEMSEHYTEMELSTLDASADSLLSEFELQYELDTQVVKKRRLLTK